PLVPSLVTGTAVEREVARLRERVQTTTDVAELTDGVDTGAKARHPLTGELIPIWVAAYVDPDFAAGAVMGNPCHDRRDHAFGRRHGLAGRSVLSPADSVWDYLERGPYLGDGLLRDSQAFTGRAALEARDDVIADWELRGIGKRVTVFAIRDWLISRQRAWGTPVPIVHCTECGEVPVARHELPVLLPKNLRDEDEGNPLSRRPEFVACQCPRCRRAARRETDTMDTFIDTAWYYLRCTNPEYPESLCDPAAVARWGPADLYIGGIEIAVPIMLYGSFIAKGLRDSGHIDFPLPCRQLLAHEMVLKDGSKMSKSLQNTVDPQELIDEVGADTVRLLILSLAPPLKKIEWSESRLHGCHRFLLRVWKLGVRHAARARDGATGGCTLGTIESLSRHVQGAIRDVTRDLEKLQLNTCITALIKLFYHLEEVESTHREDPAFHDAFCTFLRLLSPFTPHLCEELWSRMAERGQLSESEWPSYDPELVARATVSIVVKINSKPVVRLDVPTDAERDEVLAIVHENQTVRDRIGQGTIDREIYVPGQIVNIVSGAAEPGSACV
ncbi:MAG: class I tRNA ligase family protein, partial [Myxococcota bacterium]